MFTKGHNRYWLSSVMYLVHADVEPRDCGLVHHLCKSSRWLLLCFPFFPSSFFCFSISELSSFPIHIVWEWSLNPVLCYSSIPTIYFDTKTHTHALSSASPVISLLSVWILPSASLLKLPYSVNKHPLDNRLDTIFCIQMFSGLSVGTIGHIIPSRPPPPPQVSLVLCTSDSSKMRKPFGWCFLASGNKKKSMLFLHSPSFVVAQIYAVY